MGALLAVAVTWGTSWVSWQFVWKSKRSLAAMTFVQEQRRFSWLVAEHPEWPWTVAEARQRSALFADDVEIAHSPLGPDSRKSCVYISVRSMGVPFRCLYLGSYCETGPMGDDIKLEPCGVWTVQTPFLAGDFHDLPTIPLWPGFALNTLFYAALAWGLWQLPLAIRRRRRRSKGLCVRCGYDLKGLAAGAVCPECGRPALARS